MKTVQQILHAKSRAVFTVSPATTVYEALAIMARHDVGALIVLDRDQLVGIFSERDYARKVILHGHASRDILIADIMTTHVLCARVDDTVAECMTLMTDRRVRHLPVVDESGLVGIVSIGDVVKAVLEEQQFVISQLERYITA